MHKEEGKRHCVYTYMYKLKSQVINMNHGTDSLYNAVGGMIVFDVLYMSDKID